MSARKIMLVAATMVLAAFSAALTPPPPAQAQPEFRVAYMPIFPSAPEFVKAAKGWYGKEMGVKVKELRFSSGPPIVQALAAGQVDIGYFGIGPALVAIAKGIKGKVLASIVVEQVALVAHKDFARAYKKNPGKAAIAQFEKAKGRKLRLATFPPGSTPHVMLQMWLAQIGVDPKRDVEIITMGQAQLRQAVLAQRVDGTMMLEPILTIIRRSKLPFETVLAGKDILPGQPGSVLFVKQELIDKHPKEIKKLVELHLRSIQILKDRHDEAAKIISQKIGPKVISAETSKDVLSSPYLVWRANPHGIVKGTQVYNDFQVKLGLFKKPLKMSDVFDFRFYDEVVAQNPGLKSY